MPPVFKPTARDLVILSCYAAGKTDVEVGAALGVKHAYAGVLGLRMRRRMGAIDRANAVSIAYEVGILPVPAAQLEAFRPARGRRPPLLSPEILTRTRVAMARGERVESIATRLGVGRSTLYRALAGER